MKFLLAGGGTGGHVFPAIAIADEIKKLDDKAEILFIGAKGRIEEKLVPFNNYRLETINITGFHRSNAKGNFNLPWKALVALKDCRKMIREFNPDVVIGTGGFVCGPVLYMAYRMKYPALIQEGNSYPGKTIQFLSKRVDKVVINFEETKQFLKRQNNIQRIAHPIRSSLSRVNRNEGLKFFNLPPEDKTIFIFGGSQGARGINDAVSRIAPKLYKDKINLLWQTGSSDYEKIKSEFKDFSDRIRIMEFIEKMDYAYSASDIVICRSGITSIMEIAFLGIASILVPYPFAAENHQEKNARSLEKEAAALVILQEKLDIELYGKIISLINDEDNLKKLRANVSRFADPDAARKIAVEAIKLIKN
jgi:UDP-N-acetylglucosamine--N-acetylmuramyl-(pentapeptide) pyrophosphoryl-undecaprenol N-acetylglucosamine transferase